MFVSQRCSHSSQYFLEYKNDDAEEEAEDDSMKHTLLNEH